MKHATGLIVREEQERYLERLQPPRDPLLREMEEYAGEHGVPIADPEVARLLDVLARSRALSGGARRVVEVGTAIGYATLVLARAAPDARVVTIDRDPEMLERARGYLDRAGVLGRVDMVEGEALEVLDRLDPHPGPGWDLAWIDAEKADYRRYLDRLLPSFAVGGLLLFDNLLWKGRVAEPPEDEPDADAEALHAFNAYLMMHPQLRAQVLPLGDGVGVATKIQRTVMEMGGPF